MAYFSSPAATTPEQIAIAVNAAGWLTIAAPEDETAESLAIALEAAGYHDFADPAAETGESLANLLNQDQSLGGTSRALRAWRAW